MEKQEFIVLYEEHHGKDIRNGDKILAIDAEEAVEEWAERQDSGGDYWIAGGEIPEVVVINPEGKRSSWRVRGEQAIDYFAYAI